MYPDRGCGWCCEWNFHGEDAFESSSCYPGHAAGLKRDCHGDYQEHVHLYAGEYIRFYD